MSSEPSSDVFPSELTSKYTVRYIQGDFFNWPSPENVSRLAPPKFAWTGPPPNFSKCWNHAQVLRLAPPCFEKVLSMETGPHPLKPNQRLKFAGDQMERCIHCVSSTPHVED